MGKPKVILGLVLLGFVVLFAVQNVAAVEITFLVWSFSLPRALLIFLVLCVGVIVGWLLSGLSRPKKGR